MKRFALSFLYLIATISLSAQENLLENSGFEDYKSLGGFLGTEFSGWGVPMGSTAELNDVHGGTVALYAAETNMNTNKVEQEVVGTFEEGTTYRLSIWYKVKTSKEGQDVRFNSHWVCGTEGDSEHDADVLVSEYFTSAEWKEATVETTVPKGATRFYFRAEVTKKAQVLFDDFSFAKIAKEPTAEPTLEVAPQTLSAVKATINNAVDFEALTIRHANLTSPILLDITGTNRDFFSLNRTTISETEEKVVITYLPTAIGNHTAYLMIDNADNPELSQMIKLSASATDPTAKPTLTVTPLSLPDFAAKVTEEQTCTLTVKSENATDYVYAHVAHSKGAAFFINNAMLPKNMESQVVVTFRPTTAGEFASTVTFSTAGAASVMINLQGTATADETEQLEYDTAFVWNQSAPYKLLNETFDDALHNKMLTLTDWQNVVPKGNRPWWGFDHKDAEDNVIEKSAKATTYIYQQANTTGERAEMWLVTPALDYKNAAGKVFTFRVMGDFMFEGHDTQLEVYYIDATPGLELYQQKIDVELPTIPDQNREWIDYHMDLNGQNIADVFFMAFRYDGQVGENNAVTYYIDDISWGRTDLPLITSDSVQIVSIAQPNEATPIGVVTITAANLTEDIKITLAGSNASNFAVSAETLPRTGGQLSVTFQSDQIGVHEAYLKLSSRGAVDKYIPMAVLCQEGTALENTDANHTTNVRKVFENGTIYIIRNTEKYTVDGLRVKRF